MNGRIVRKMSGVSFQKARGERGQLLPLAIILLSVGALIVTGLLPYVSVMLQSGYQERELAMARYTAEAGINRVVADMVRGADAYPTTYTTTQPHIGGGSYQTFTITTSYTIPSVTVNDYATSIQISLPTQSQAKPASQQNYVDPGVTHPYLATIQGGYAYLMRLYNVKAGILQVNWAYSPQGNTRIGVWAGMPVDKSTNAPFPPGQLAQWPQESPILDTGFAPSNVDYNRTGAIVVDPATDGSGGVYTIAFNAKTSNLATLPFQPSGGLHDTWIYVKAYKDYIITATAGGVSISTYVRQSPGFSEPPVWTTGWAVNNPGWITNGVYVYTWSPP
ncbi:MAG: hypothetical protein Q8O43_05090 [Dehalococcoidia bacterium]|nr:hypothetical protein [Dehalococcoidia bacterium]